LVQRADSTTGSEASASGQGLGPRPFWRRGSSRSHEAELIASLNDVASAVSSKLSLEEVLRTIAERAKLVTNTDKAALVLTGSHGESLDLDTLVVRGQRSEHPQREWEARLAGISARAFASGKAVLDVDEEHGLRILASPVKVKTKAIGIIVAINAENRRFSTEHENFLSILSAFAASAIENARLAEQGRYVMLSSERDRIARDMHDGIAQSLFSMSLALEVCRKKIRTDPANVAARLAELQHQLDGAREELRGYIYDLRPVKLSELGLEGAVEYWIHEITSGRAVEGALKVEGTSVQLPPSQEACLYRVAKEAVSNSVQHARGTLVDVRIAYTAHAVALTVVDDGCGFANGNEAAEGRGLGLRSIRERVEREGGQLMIESGPGMGTRVHVEIPIGGM
jgi:signal transduction histidine kinase